MPGRSVRVEPFDSGLTQVPGTLCVLCDLCGLIAFFNKDLWGARHG